MFRFLKSLLSSVTEPDEIVVDIEELSQIWLKYNTSFEPIKSPPESETGPIETVPAQKGPEGKPFYIQGVLMEFYEPYRALLESQGVREGFLSILKLLDELGNCPSVVVKGQGVDNEAQEVYKVREILEKVSLREHSINVARVFLKLLKETYKDYESLLPKALVVSFGHDLGKIPELRGSGLYAKADHPLISAQKLQELFSDSEPLWFEGALDAVRNHHRSSKDPFTILFKKADSRAREMEIGLYGKEFRVMEWEKWFDVKEYLELLSPEVNVIQTGNRWKAFSFGSVVYCQPDFLYEGARELATKKKVLDMRLTKESEKEAALGKIVDSLRREGALGPEIGESFIGRKYMIQGDKFRKKMFLVPIKIEAFGVPHEIEARKEGYLEIIRSVVPE